MSSSSEYQTNSSGDSATDDDDEEMELESEDDEERDRLSELPHSLIHLILSFMPIRDVVSTTLLSKNWNKFWTEVPYFNIRERISEGNGVERVRNFVNRALMLWRGKEILKFGIDIKNFDLSLFGDVDLWVRFAVEHKVEELNLSLDMKGMIWNDPVTDSKKDVYWAPQCLNLCSSIRKLSLQCCNLRIDVSPSWNQLKCLRIQGFCFGECLINRILLGSPQLEVFELVQMESYESLNIQSSSLKELKIHKGGLKVQYVSSPPLETVDTMLRIRCPNLEVLKISGYLYSKCLFSDFPSLTDVTLGLVPCIIYPNGACIAFELLGWAFWGHFFSTIQHAEKVTLSVSCQVLKLQKKYLLSPLPNAKFLKLGALDTDIGDMMDFIGIFPNIEMLVLEVVGSDSVPQKIIPEDYLDFDANPCDPPMLKLKKVQIISPFKNTLILRFIAFLLHHCSMLEKLVIQAIRCPSGDQHERLFEVAQALLNMPKSSPTARVIFKKV